MTYHVIRASPAPAPDSSAVPRNQSRSQTWSCSNLGTRLSQTPPSMGLVYAKAGLWTGLMDWTIIIIIIIIIFEIHTNTHQYTPIIGVQVYA